MAKLMVRDYLNPNTNQMETVQGVFVADGSVAAWQAAGWRLADTFTPGPSNVPARITYADAIAAKEAAIAAKNAAQTILDQVESGAVPDSAVATLLGDPGSSSRTVLDAAYVRFDPDAPSGSKLLAPTVNEIGWHLIQGALTAALRSGIAARNYDYSRIVHLTDHGGKFDRRAATITTTAGSTTLTAPNGAFTSADIGKLVFVPGAGAAAQPWNGALVANISTVVSATQVTVGTAATAAVSAVAGYVGTNNDAAWDAAHAKLGTGGGTLVLPPGDGMHATQKTPLSRVRYQGAGRDITVMHPVASVNGFIRWGDVDDALTGTTFADFTIDGDMQTNGDGAGSKGTGLYYMQDCVFDRVTVRNTAGSGFGNDFHRDCYYLQCKAENNGRIGTVSSPGHSGFGFGTGGWEHEHVFVVECVSMDNMRHGLFMEWQPDITPDNEWQSTPGLTVIGGRFERNGISGISDQACGGAIIQGAHLIDNDLDGFSVTTMPPQLHRTATRGLLSDCFISGSGRWGIDLYAPDVELAELGFYRIINNQVEDSGDHGIQVRVHSRHVMPSVEIMWNTSRNNRKNGIRIGGAVKNMRIVGNTCENNGRGSDDAGAGLGGPDRNGIALHGTMTDSEIMHNVCRDTRSTGKTQLHGLLMTASAPVSSIDGDSRVVGNDFRGNGTAGIAGSTQFGTTCRVRDNDGFNPIGADSITPTGSPYTYTTGPYRQTLYIIGGTFETIKINTVTVYNSGAVAGTLVLPVDAGATVEFTYSAVPIAIKRWRH
jgi:hypothetical protein